MNQIVPTWPEVTQWIDVQLKNARERLEGDVGHDETQKLRGEIRALKRLQRWPEQRATAANRTQPFPDYAGNG